MEFPFRIKGRVAYDPHRSASFVKKGRNQWWCVIELPPGLVDYLRWQLTAYWMDVHPGIRPTVFRPIHRDHISVVRGEVPRFPEMWKYRHGESVDVMYNYDLKQAPDHWYVNCYVEAKWDIRRNLGLRNEGYVNGVMKPYNSHITFAKKTP